MKTRKPGVIVKGDRSSTRNSEEDYPVLLELEPVMYRRGQGSVGFGPPIQR